MIETELLLGVVAAGLGALLPYLKNKKAVSEEQAEMMFNLSEKLLYDASEKHPDDKTLMKGIVAFQKLKEGWYDETVSTAQMNARLELWGDSRYRKLKDL